MSQDVGSSSHAAVLGSPPHAPPDGAAASRKRTVSVIAIVGFAHGVSHFFHLLLAPLFPALMREFGLSYTQVGATMTVFFVISGVGQALAGFAVDRLGSRHVLYFGVSCLIAAALCLASAQSYAGLFLAAGLAGLGNAVFHPADFTLLNRQVPAERLGHAFAVHGVSGNLGWTAAPIFLTTLAAAAGWRIAALGAAGLALAALLALIGWRHLLKEGVSGASTPRAHVQTPASTFGFLGVGAVWLCFAFFFTTTTAFGAFQNFGGPVLQHVYGITAAVATSAVAAFLLGGAGGIVVGGFLAGRSPAHDKRIALVLLAAACMALLLSTGWAPGPLVPVLMACVGFCTGLAGPSRDLLVRRAATGRFGQQAFGRVYGFVYAGLDSGLAFSPLVFGPLMDRGQFAAVLVGVAILQGCAVLTALGVGRQSVAKSPT